METLKARIFDYWRGLSQREQHLFVMLGVVLMIAILWMGIVNPIQNWRETSIQQWQENSKLLHQSENIQQQEVQHNDQRPLRIIIINAIQHSQLTMVQMQMLDNDQSIRVTVQGTDYLTILAWLQKMEKDGLKLSQSSLRFVNDAITAEVVLSQ